MHPVTPYGHLSDDELLRNVSAAIKPSPLEIELAYRLEQALNLLDDLAEGVK